MNVRTICALTHQCIVRPAIAALLLLGGAPVLAQTAETPSTRAALLESARDTLTSESVKPQRSTIERGLFWYDNQYVFAKLFGGWKGIHLAGGDFPAGAGLKFGIGYDKALTSADPDPTPPQPRRSHRTRRVQHQRLRARERRRRTHAISAVCRSMLACSVSTTSSRRRSSSALGWTASSRIGPTISWTRGRPASPSDGSRPGSSSAVAWPTSVRRSGGGQTALFPSTDDVFTAADAPGSRDRDGLSEGRSLRGARLARQPRPPSRRRPVCGRVDELRRSRPRSATTFSRVSVSLQHYVPLPDRYRLVALRAEGVFTNAESDHPCRSICSRRSAAPAHLRGFRESRFRDENSVLIGAEYRWEAWWALDGALFVDAGMVAPSRESLSLRNMEVGYGIGFRFHSNAPSSRASTWRSVARALSPPEVRTCVLNPSRHRSGCRPWHVRRCRHHWPKPSRAVDRVGSIQTIRSGATTTCVRLPSPRNTICPRLRVRCQHLWRDGALIRARAQREHARRSAGFQLVYESPRAARHDAGRRPPWPEPGRRSGAGPMARDRAAGLRHHA